MRTGEADAAPRCNALTVDVEDYFHVAAFESCVLSRQWDALPLRVGDNTRRVLDLFDRHGVRGTFFVLGWVAERLPDLVREIVRRGHELASHGYGHQRIHCLTPEAFRQDVRSAKRILEDLGGVEVAGYRAPTYSVTRQTLWALPILVEEGYRYDSSIFPIRHDLYGIPGHERFPHRLMTESGPLWEFPITTAKMRVGWRTLNAPVAGGGYLRLFPVSWIEKGLRSVNEREGKPFVLYFHPWEIDPDQPRVRNAPLRSRFRHYVNLSRMEGKVERLLTKFSFAPMARAFDEAAPPQGAGA